jgi:23S rRNA pseudouridine1911/1915/1917 synthase
MVEIDPPPLLPASLKPENIPLSILFEDEWIIAIDKPAGLIVHPGAGRRMGTISAALLHHCRGSLSGIGGVERPGIVHRLDKDTSGVLVSAKTDEAHRALAAQFKERLAKKTYLAFVAAKPRPPSGKWMGPIGRHPVDRKKMAVLHSRGRAALTEYELVEDWGKAFLLRLRIHSGRTHQIRVHAAHAGCPVIGDALYGHQPAWVGTFAPGRHLLHAERLELTHPATGDRISFVAPAPAIFEGLRAFLREQK